MTEKWMKIQWWKSVDPLVVSRVSKSVWFPSAATRDNSGKVSVGVGRKETLIPSFLIFTLSLLHSLRASNTTQANYHTQKHLNMGEGLRSQWFYTHIHKPAETTVECKTTGTGQKSRWAKLQRYVYHFLCVTAVLEEEEHIQLHANV